MKIDTLLRRKTLFGILITITYALANFALGYLATPPRYIQPKNPSFQPSRLDIAEASKDYQLAADLKELLRELATLSLAMEDNLMVAGPEAYDAALIFHASVRSASRANTPGSQAIYDDLAQRFPGRRFLEKGSCGFVFSGPLPFR